jgi:hypothetical protein
MATTKKKLKKPMLGMEQEVLDLLKNNPKSNKEMRQALGLSTEHYDPRLDRALQRMRKEGKLKLLNSRWIVGHTQVCSTCGGKGWMKVQ